MARRYARIDVDFFHKRTAAALEQRFGIAGQAVFLALILRAKDGVVPGTFTYSTEAVAWDKLGINGDALDFTLDEFLAVTGRLKQTSRTRVGHLMNVKLTRYGDWQKESRRYEEAVRKASKRGESTADTQRTPRGTRSGHKVGPSSTSTSTPQTPHSNGKASFPCSHPHCSKTLRSRDELSGHLEDVHGITPASADIPF